MSGVTEMTELLANEFGQDPLFKLIGRMGLEEDLFDEHMQSLRIGIEYSTTDIETWYCNDNLKPATMRSWVKALEEYIELRTIGIRGNIRMDYRAVFRLRMALLLRQHNVQLLRVCQHVGLKPVDPEIVSADRRHNQTMPTATKDSQESEVTRNIIGQMIALGMINIQEGMPVLRIKEYIQDQVKAVQQNYLPDPEIEDKRIDEKIGKIEETLVTRMESEAKQIRIEQREQRKNMILTNNKINKALEEEANRIWNDKPLEERTIKVGLFKRIEDHNAKLAFVKQYQNEHFEERLAKEFGE